jgi:hypothetical protein
MALLLRINEFNQMLLMLDASAHFDKIIHDQTSLREVNIKPIVSYPKG